MAAFCRSALVLRHFLPRITADAAKSTRAFTPKLFSTSTKAAFSQFARTRSAGAPSITTSVFERAESTAEDVKSSAKPKSSSFPKTSHKSVAYWLLGSAASVYGIVIFGGLTRLTESGLSITEWKPVTGSRPPMNQADWDSEFAKYRASPEFVRLNSRMSLDEFKKIYWMEWTHRLWGRVIGVTFLVPTIYFIAKRRVASHMAWKISGICGLIGFQGMIGWWMVKSGLKDDLFDPRSNPPRVSQYRLAAHLGIAFLAYSAMIVTGLSILREHALLKDPKAALSLIEKISLPHMRRFRLAATIVTGLIFTTAMSGALVAGLDAGMIYNEFPWMGLGLTPPKAELWNAHYSQKQDQSDLWWRNMLENPSLVQLDHRMLAMTTFTSIVALALWPRFSGPLKAIMPRKQMKSVNAVVHMATLQVVLGISTLIYMVPTWLGAAHQAGALALLTTAVVLGSRFRVPPRTVQLIQSALKRQQQRVSSVTPASLKHSTGSVQQVVR